jgi:hypothetical protein
MTEIPQALSEILRVLQTGSIAAISMQTGSAEGWRTGGSLPGRRWFTLVGSDKFAIMMANCGFCEMECRIVGRAGWYVMYGTRPTAA